MNLTFRKKGQQENSKKIKEAKNKNIEDHTNYYRFFWLLCFSFFLYVRMAKPRVDSELSIEDKGGKMEMDAVNYGYHTETTHHV